MADPVSGPRIPYDPASDVADVFASPSPDRPGCLVLVLDVFPAAAPTAPFSDAITYRFRVRPVAPAADRAAFTDCRPTRLPAFSCGRPTRSRDG